ncbi:DUF3093 domain-containing protein [Agrococcus sediminis]|jgi:hypothetical protein|uniref:DUF3093 domain-containing protein n=1 Tax=Agrococcus TaxID=46352 RepID=UPI001FF382F1|nr:DUF3093 domain-containing protein [Agrococcus sp. SCSIO52902]UOW00570.1 DUF3093 domain-containing protein [Agrococcus sp. SCSIO52902]
MDPASSSYRERLTPPWWLPLLLLLIVPAALLVFLPVDLGVGVGVAAVLYLGIVTALWVGAPVVEVRDGMLHAGRARIATALLGAPEALRGDEARAAMRAEWDPASHHVISPWTRGLVRVAVDDESDPTPSWVMSSRRPERLAAAIDAARASA